MATKKTPKGAIKEFFEGFSLKRGRPSVSPSDGAVSQVEKSAKIHEDIPDVRMDLAAEFEEAMETGMSADAEKALEDFDKNMQVYFKDFREKVTKQLKKVIRKVDDRLNDLTGRVRELEEECVRKDECIQEMKKLHIEVNRVAQYTLKDNVRILGLPEKKTEDCREVVCALVSDKVKVQLEPKDVSIAHRLVKPEKQQHKPIIAKLKDRTQRLDILKKRKILKGSGITIMEDITKANLQLTRDAEDSGVFEAVWFWNGRVHALAKGYPKDKLTLTLFDDFEKYRKQPKD